ncbi:hypothetical protein F4824DRAFT_464044 [Ustulina deusta]|nr:hypothetical protein F4824DRAFT_464044 [Ustulina deusta]
MARDISFLFLPWRQLTPLPSYLLNCADKIESVKKPPNQTQLRWITNLVLMTCHKGSSCYLRPRRIRAHLLISQFVSLCSSLLYSYSAAAVKILRDLRGSIASLSVVIRPAKLRWVSSMPSCPPHYICYPGPDRRSTADVGLCLISSGLFVIGPVIAVVVLVSSSIKGRREFYSKPKPSVDKQLGIVSSYQNHYRQQSHSELRKKRNSAIASEESEPQLGSLASLNH